MNTKNEKKVTFQTIQAYYLYFMLYAVFGWLYEVTLETVIYRWGFSNRGVLFGPYCPVYGVGAFAFLFVVYPLLRQKNQKQRLLLLPLIYVLCALLATAIELVTSYLCEFTIGYIPWDYTSYKYNFQARIALSTSLRFGLGGVLFLYVLQPLFEKMNAKLSDRTRTIIFCVVLGLFLIDVIVTLYFQIPSTKTPL